MKILILALLCFPIISQAQLSQNLGKRFPAHIIDKIDDVILKVNLTEDKQIKIGQKLFTVDSLANINLVKGEAVNKIKSYYIIDNNFLKPILSPEELDNYGYAINKDNRYLVALKFALELKLDPKQISEIRKQNDSLVAVPKMSTKETIQIYNEKLNTILTKEQYVLLLKTIYKEQSVEETQNDWAKIKQLKLVADENDKTELTKIFNYHLGKNIFLDIKADRHDKSKRDILAEKMTLGQPFLLVHANILSEGIYINNKYSSVIKYEKELELTKSQIDTLLLKYMQLERIKFDNTDTEFVKPPTAIPSEYENIITILNPEQLKKWLLSKNVKEAKKEGLKNWWKLETAGLTKDLEKEKTIAELSVYQLKYLIAKERVTIYHTSEDMILKRDIELKRPELLKQLDALAASKAKNGGVKNALTW